MWYEECTKSKISVIDIFNCIPKYMLSADIIYTDPPWNTGNLRSFYTKAGMTTNRSFEEFLSVLTKHIHTISPEVCYLEIGSKHRDAIISMLSQEFKVVQFWKITYYRKNVCWLIRGSDRATDVDFAGIDDSKTPFVVAQHELPGVVADLCTGRGLTGVAAYKANRTFYGTELNKRRLAVLMDRTSRMGARWFRC